MKGHTEEMPACKTVYAESLIYVFLCKDLENQSSAAPVTTAVSQTVPSWPAGCQASWLGVDTAGDPEDKDKDP